MLIKVKKNKKIGGVMKCIIRNLFFRSKFGENREKELQQVVKRELNRKADL